MLALFCGFAFNTDAFDIIVDIDMSRKNKYQIFQNTTLSVKDLCASTMTTTLTAQWEGVHQGDLGISKIPKPVLICLNKYRIVLEVTLCLV